jgi:hypothetical protein
MDSKESELTSTLSHIRNASLDMLKTSYQESIPAHLQVALSGHFWESFSDDKLVTIGLRACLAIWAASNFQVEQRPP